LPENYEEFIKKQKDSISFKIFKNLDDVDDFYNTFIKKSDDNSNI